MSTTQDPLPARIPVDSNFFPEKAFELVAGSAIRAFTTGAMGATTVKLADGREVTYELSTNPQEPGWLLARL